MSIILILELSPEAIKILLGEVLKYLARVFIISLLALPSIGGDLTETI